MDAFMQMRQRLAFDLETYLHDCLETLDFVLRDSSSQRGYFKPTHPPHCLGCFRYGFFNRVREALWRFAHNFDILPDQTGHFLARDTCRETITLFVKMMEESARPIE